MAQFSYKARSGPDHLISGLIEANSMAEAVKSLTISGKIPIEIEPNAGSSDAHISQKALFQFTRQLAELLEAGLPLVRCMELLARQRQFPQMAGMIEGMIKLLQQGGSLSLALSKYPGIFSPLYIHTVKAAESSGQLPLVLNRLAQFLETDMQMRSKILSSLLYPAIIFCVGLLTIFVLLSFVLPRLTVMFEDFDAKLPLVTRMVVAVSHVFASFWWLMAAVVAGGIIGARSYFKTDEGRAWVDGFVLKVPLLNVFIKNVELSRFARTLGMLLASGVPIVTALDSVTMVVGNSVLRSEVMTMALNVKSGMSLSQAIRASALFPEMAVDFIIIGQESGKLERGLYHLALFCERSSNSTAETFVTILGPAVLVMVVGAVGFMIIAMLLPMFQMNMIIN